MRHRVRWWAGRPRAVVAVLAVLALLAGCSGQESTDAEAPTPEALLETARTTLDAAPSLSFELTSENVTARGAALVGGTGDLARPDSFQGTLDVLIAGSTATVQVVSVGGTFYAQLPFTTAFSVVDPQSLGFTDPGSFMDPDTGITRLLSQAQDPQLGAEARLDGVVVREVSAVLPGAVVGDLLVSADPTRDVPVTFSIATSSGELRRAVLVGPFYSADVDSTFTITLRDYGAPVDITAPPTG